MTINIDLSNAVLEIVHWFDELFHYVYFWFSNNSKSFFFLLILILMFVTNPFCDA